jgi:uncharacterized protein YjbI with pentapeptide repeats
MIYSLLQETSSGPSALLSGGVVGAVVGLVGVVTGQYLTQRRHSQALRQTAELEAQRAHAAALEKYVAHFGKLLTEQQLHHAAADDHLRAVARAHTLAVLEGLDPDRKRVLLQFLHESNLIHLDKPIISLLGANLKGADLKGAHLHRANLKGADLRGADLREANLKEANLQKALFAGANLQGANLEKANLQEAIALTQEQLEHASGDENIKMPEGLKVPKSWTQG